jgi:hypothetical protein
VTGESWRPNKVVGGTVYVMVHEGAVRLPTTLRAAYRTELFRAFHAPYETPIVVAVNGVLMGVLWVWAPAGSLFSIHKIWAFPLILASWMYSDVPATNVFGSDAKRMTAAFDDLPAMRRMLYAKNLVLMTLVVPIASTVAVLVAVQMDRSIVAVWNVALVVLVPLGALGISGWFGIYFPYHPIPLKDRWRHRSPFWHMIVRWLTVAIVPYGLVPALSFLVIGPTTLVWKIVGGVDPSTGGQDTVFVVGIAVACVIAVALWIFGHHFAIRLAVRRKEVLVEYLADPSNG